MELFPFPDKTACMEELKRDKYFSRIPPEDYTRILDAAWLRGEQAAQNYFAGAETDIYGALEQAGLQIQRIGQDMVIGETRYFAEIYVKAKKVNVYVPSVGLWAEHNGMSPEQAEELILAHEYFHYLEYCELSSTKQIYSVPILRFNHRVVISASLYSLSEIGAHSFARAYYQLKMNH